MRAGEGWRTRRMRVVVFTTSYPRHERDWVGRFVADAVDAVRARGVEVDVVSPGVFRDFGLAYGNGVVANAKRRPWLALPMLASMVRTLRRRARGADLVHAHWLLAGAVARLAGCRFVLTLHGSGSAGRFSDLELARRNPRFVRWIVSRAEVVLCVSSPLADAARACGARDVRVVPNGVTVPAEVVEPDSPPHALFAGRLSPEKGVEDLLAVADGLPIRWVGDGPLRHLVPQSLGMLEPDDLEREYDACAVLVLPSRSEGFGVVAAEAMAHGRPVVATRVGGLVDVVVDGETGVLVEPGNGEQLRAELERLLADSAERARMGGAARARASKRFGWGAVGAQLLAAYEDACR